MAIATNPSIRASFGVKLCFSHHICPRPLGGGGGGGVGGGGGGGGGERRGGGGGTNRRDGGFGRP